MSVDLKKHKELMGHFVLQAKMWVAEIYPNDPAKFIGDYLHSATLLHDTMSRESMHRESLEERRQRYGGQ